MSCESKKTATEQNKQVCVKMETTMGNIVVKLYNETPAHRDNFVKLVKEGYYDGTLFHRVINQFMIQGGDGDSRNAKPGQQLGMGDPGYTIPAEFVYPKYFHKKGALAAARQGDQVNPEKASSGSQFYIVTGNVIPEGQIGQFERQLQMQQEQNVFNTLVAAHREEIMNMRRNRDQAGLQALQEQLINETRQQVAREGAFTLTPEQKAAYTTVGGAPHLDGAYTVFGEVVEGMDVVEKIEKVETDRADRPVADVRVISMKIVEE
ncbi:MAG: peptidylprolyl isomerase [Bacteroidaceae bacterium]|nr:peptidylprolyl isomerase [Bacteroidaceae bacterium]